MNTIIKSQKKAIKRFFWDVDFDTIDFKENKEYVIARILEYGDIKAITWLFENYDKKTIKKMLMNQRGFSKRTANFWSKILDVDKDKIQCLKKSYQKVQEAHWPY